MGKRDRINRIFRGPKTPVSEPASVSVGTALEPRLSEPTDRANESTSATESTAKEPSRIEPTERGNESASNTTTTALEPCLNEPTDGGNESACNTASPLKESHLNDATDRANESAFNTASTGLEPHLNEPRNKAKEASPTDNQSQDAPIKDLWGLAFEKLSSEEKETMLGIGLDSKLDILHHLQATAKSKQTESETRRWKFELNGRQIIVRDVLEKIIVWIDKFKQIGDIVVTYDPVHASLLWAGIRFLLQVGLIRWIQFMDRG